VPPVQSASALVNGVGPEPGHWSHAEPSPNGHEPVLD
jgi:hypothetical protein